MAVSIKYIIKKEVRDVNDCIGGITIAITGELIPKLVNEDNFESRYPWKPAYLGQYIQTDFHRLLNVASALAKGEVDLYEPKKITFPPSKAHFLVEPLSAEKIRIAYRIRQSTEKDQTDKPLLAAPETACGYVVDRCEFCRAVSEAAREYIADVRSMPLEWGFDLLEELEGAVDELDAALANCE